MPPFTGTKLVAIDVQMPRLWEIVDGSSRVRQTVLGELIRSTQPGTIANQVHIRVPFNPTLNENQLEMLIDSVLTIGYRFKECVTSQYGLYHQTWVFSLS